MKYSSQFVCTCCSPSFASQLSGGYTGKDPLDNTYTRNMYIVKH
ncbi:hypothetical protein EC991775_1612 [Escherichia coli 99.1775]|nr:hypothetical protein EC991775_1612 [Escherichia coli 99.1775]